MPIHYTIIYDSSTGSQSCSSGGTVTVELVQDAIVKHDRSYVEAVEIVYSQDALGDYPTTSFLLEIENTSYEVKPIESVPIDGANPFTYGLTENATSYEFDINPPTGTDDVLTLFNFGDESGPPTKLVVKVKRKPTFSCP